MKASTLKKIALLLLGIYLLFLIWAVLFKFQLSFNQLPHLQHINLTPLGDSSYKKGKFNTFEVLGNLVIFFPFGLYLNIIPYRLSYLKQVLLMFFISLGFEIIQYVFAIGVSDITDLLMNVSGGIIGILTYLLLLKLLKNKALIDRLLIIAACTGTIFIIGLSFILLMNNLK